MPGLQGPRGSLTHGRAHTGVAQLLALVRCSVPGAQLVEELPHEVVLALPYTGAHDGSFVQLFRDLDRRLCELGLSGYGISDTSLEEVRGGGGGHLAEAVL